MTAFFDPNAGSDPARIEALLPRVRKPARYIGGEVNMVRKDPASVGLRLALAFPDVYEVGMSHLGLRILYGIVNSRPEYWAERVFAPWPDLEELLRDYNLPLTTLESGTPLSEFDIVGFSLQYELCATNVLQMLELGGIPLRAEDRGDDDPLVIAGGPIAFNPAPWAPFFDALVIGEGEELILDLCDAAFELKREGAARSDVQARWKELKGVCVPALHHAGESVSRRIVPDLDRARFPEDLVVPYCETVHDRIGLEIARGCTRGCRFCQAGMIYRPVRERDADSIVELARRNLEVTGWDEISLLSLSSGDYSCILDLIERMVEEFGGDRTALSLPSLRTETFDGEMAEQIRKVRKTGFTLAPEAGTDRLRRVINKGNQEEDLERAVSTAFSHGWRSLKLYFMIGLPGETDEDLDGIIGLIRRASKWAHGKKITASVSTFVPKCHTPFQWAEQISIDETLRRQAHIRMFFRKGRTRVKFHDPRSSFLEGVIARGDRALAPVIERAYRLGARFDGWDEHLHFDTWLQAFEDSGVDPNDYLRARETDEELPWGIVDTGVSRDFLIREWERAFSEEPTPDCRFGECEGCGVCDFEAIFPKSCEKMTAKPFEEAPPGNASDEGEIRRFRLRYAKGGAIRFLGHRDIIRTFHRAFRRAGLTLDYSRGFHPHPRLRFSPPLSVGIESVSEYLDFDLRDSTDDLAIVRAALEKNLPKGMDVLDIKEIPLNSRPLSGMIQSFTYEISASDPLTPEEMALRVKEFERADSLPITVGRKEKGRRVDLKEWVRGIELTGSVLSLTLGVEREGAVNPFDAAAGLLGRSREEVRSLRIRKTSARLAESSCEDEGNSHGQRDRDEHHGTGKPSGSH
jgi:radical SAM family uncharacterized protein/radical SAM-linked protein